MVNLHAVGWAALALGLTPLVPQRAEGALGDVAASVDADAKAVGAVRREATVHRAYRVERLRKGSTEVREYVSPAGTVFAVAWNGPSQPDLDVLLGRHAAEYRQAAQRTRAARARRSQRVVAAGVVVETWGHLRHLQGRAWLPAELPDGVSADDIR